MRRKPAEKIIVVFLKHLILDVGALHHQYQQQMLQKSTLEIILNKIKRAFFFVDISAIVQCAPNRNVDFT